MRKIALTGGPGCGKSTVARMFRELGAEVLDADEVAAAVVQPGKPAWEDLRREFGPEFFLPDGTLDRAKMAALVFRDPQARDRLNAIVHPRLREEVRRRLTELEARGTRLVIVEVPLLFETGAERHFDRVIVVEAEEAQQLERLRSRDARSLSEAAGILAAQWPLAAKKARADYVVDNRGPLDKTKKQIKKLWQELQILLDKDPEKS